MKHAQPPASVLLLIETSYRSSLVNQPYPHVLVYDTKQKSRSNLHLPLKLLIHFIRFGLGVISVSAVDLDGRYYVLASRDPRHIRKDSKKNGLLP